MFYLQPLTLTLLLGFLFLGVSALQTLSPSTTTVVPLIVSKKDNSSEVNKTNQETSAKGVKNAEISPSPPPSMPKGPRAYTTQPPSTDEKASGAKNKSSMGTEDTSSKMLSDEEWGSIEFSAMNEKGNDYTETDGFEHGDSSDDDYTEAYQSRPGASHKTKSDQKKKKSRNPTVAQLRSAQRRSGKGKKDDGVIAMKPPKKWKEIGGIEESQDKKKKKKDYSFQLPADINDLDYDKITSGWNCPCLKTCKHKRGRSRYKCEKRCKCRG